MPDTTTESTLSDLKGKTLIGWEEIRQALLVVGRISEKEHNGVSIANMKV